MRSSSIYLEKTGLNCIEMMPKSNKANACVIWLHGLGADGTDFVSLVDELKLPKNHNVKFIFPTALKRPVTINGGMVMNAWYDIISLDPAKRSEDEEGIQDSFAKIKALIDLEIENGIPSNKIILGGFSQGGAMSIYTATRYKSPLAAVVALSSYCLLKDKLNTEKSKENLNTPLFAAHGTFDPIVPYSLGKQVSTFMKSENYNVDFRSYSMEHTVCYEEINDISNFVKQVLEL